MLARRIDEIGVSATLAVGELAARMRAQGLDIVDLGVGEPDFPTPARVKEAGKQAIDGDRTRYTATAGVLELREAIAARLERDRGLDYAPDELLVSPGTKASLYLAFQALLDPGDEVLLPVPYWTSYPEQIRLAGAVPVCVAGSGSRGFKLSAPELEAAATPRARAVVLNYPANPTGACYTRHELEPLAEVCVRRGLWIVADEIYSRLLYDGRAFTSIAELGPRVRERTVLVDGLSKSYSMTGWRIGYAAGPREVIAGMAKLQSHSVSHPSSISQWASIEALQLVEGEIEARRREFERRRDVVLECLGRVPGLACSAPEGAFYVFPDVSGHLAGAVRSSQQLAQYLLEQARVAVVPGEAFGAPGHIRLSYAAPVERLREGLARIARALEGLAAGR